MMKTVVRVEGLSKIVAYKETDARGDVAVQRYDVEVEGAGVFRSFSDLRAAEAYLNVLLDHESQGANPN